MSLNCGYFSERLCKLLVRYCNSSVAEVRGKAAAFLYMLMRENMKSKHTEGFSRIKVG